MLHYRYVAARVAIASIDAGLHLSNTITRILKSTPLILNMSSLSFLSGSSIRSISVGWFVLCMIVCCIHLMTLELDPLTYQDEVQIVDYGRVILNPSTDWALTWYVQGDHPVIPFSYLGKLIQEAAFNLTATSGLGPRYLAMFGGVLAATCALGWLIVRNTPPIFALVLGFAFLIDPIFSDIYRGGRIDGWAIAASLGACWLLRLAASR